MKHERVTWYSPAVQRHMTIRVFGHAGARVLVFPTTWGTENEWPDRHMFRWEVLGEHCERGWIQVYCLDANHNQSWYEKSVHPGHRAWMHLQYDRYLRDEVIPFTRWKNQNPYCMSVGTSFGAYHAMTFGMRNPWLVDRIIGLSGMYDITGMTGGYYDHNVHACNPPGFVAHESNGDVIRRWQQLDIIMAIGKDDPNIQDNRDFSGVLWGKGVGNALREWNGWSHDWPYWERMIRRYINGSD